MSTAVAAQPDGVADAIAGWTPWAQSWLGGIAARSPLSPVWIGAAIAWLTWLVLLSVWWLGGEMGRYEFAAATLLQQRDARIGTIICLYVGFLPAAQVLLLRATRNNLRALEPVLGRGVEALALRSPRFWTVTLPGVLAMPIVALAVDRDPGLYFTRDYLSLPSHWFTWPVGIFVTINTALLAHLSNGCARAVAARVDALGPVDLLDLSPLAPFTRHTLQTALLWLVMLSIFSVNATDAGFRIALAAVAVFAVAQIAVCALAIHRALQRRLVDRKRAETGLVHRALRGDTDAAAALEIGARGAELSVADLLAYRSFVEGVRVSAFDTSAWLRAALYVAIPLGSWLGGALVERLLDASLR